MAGFNHVHRYMLTQTLVGLGMAAGVIGAVIILVDFVEQSRAIGTRVDINAMELVGLTMLKTPALLETTLPFIFLFGVLTALFRLNRRSELVVMRGSGMSAWRILSAPMILALLVGVFGALVLNPLGAAGNAAFEARRDARRSDCPACARIRDAPARLSARPDLQRRARAYHQRARQM